MYDISRRASNRMVWYDMVGQGSACHAVVWYGRVMGMDLGLLLGLPKAVDATVDHSERDVMRSV